MQLRRLWIFCFCSFLFSTAVYAQTPISIVRGMLPGSVVTTTGTITTGDEWGIIRYMQDDEAGIALYDSDLSGTQAGDSIVVTGVLSMFRGEVQLSPIISFSIHSQGNVIVPVEISSFCESETLDLFARIVTLSCARVSSCVTTIAEESYLFYDRKGCRKKGIFEGDSHLINAPLPAQEISITGIWSTQDDETRLLMTSLSDSPSSCIMFSPGLISFENNQLSMVWETPQGNEQSFQWGIDGFDQTEALGPSGIVLQYQPQHLEPHQVYRSRLMSHSTEGDTIYSPELRIALPTFGNDVQVLFNRSINTAFSDGSTPLATGSSAIEADVIDRIDAAQHSLDVAMYNTNRTTIVSALNRAHQRGVIVRYIADDETSNNALDNAQFPVFYRSGDGIMHHKFIAADTDHDEIAWVWTGSTNFSTNQLSSDPNHACIIQERAIAQTFREEFEEMWGTNSNHLGSRTGESKENTSAHYFLHNGSGIEVWFSPSDETECHLVEAIESADHQLLIGLLLLTSEELIDAVIRQYQLGVEVRVILEDEESSEYAVSQLAAAQIPFALHAPGTIYHHKYAIIDEGFPDSDPTVVSGSHNWTWSADHINDENTILYHDQRITNIFRQEFEARWSELVSSTEDQTPPAKFSVSPNPGNSHFVIHHKKEFSGNIILQDISGVTILRQSTDGNMHQEVNIPSTVPPGMYFVSFHSSDPALAPFTTKWIKARD